jgi:metal-responsive CopG/Arc/MetJ family transcriptional regulator
MKLQLQIDEDLLQEALELGEYESQTVLIEEALRQYIESRKRLKLLDLFGTIEYEESYDYKKQRHFSNQ